MLWGILIFSLRLSDCYVQDPDISSNTGSSSIKIQNLQVLKNLFLYAIVLKLLIKIFHSFIYKLKNYLYKLYSIYHIKEPFINYTLIYRATTISICGYTTMIYTAMELTFSDTPRTILNIYLHPSEILLNPDSTSNYVVWKHLINLQGSPPSFWLSGRHETCIRQKIMQC